MQYLLDCKSVVNINDIFLGIAIDLSENTIFQLFSYVANMVRISHVMNDFYRLLEKIIDKIFAKLRNSKLLLKCLKKYCC